jgi:signal peptidase I
MRRVLVWIGIVALVLVVAGVVLRRTWLLVPMGPGGASEAPTIPACTGRMITEGLTYKIRDPRRGEMVAFRATGQLGGTITPDANGDLPVAKRVIGIPGDEVVGRNGRVYVNGVKADDIQTAPFPKVDLGSDQYFLMGDNRSYSQDSRDFGPVPRNAIFGRVLFVWWPFAHFGVLPGRISGAPPGPISC